MMMKKKGVDLDWAFDGVKILVYPLVFRPRG
jgi:hypothetical protein